MARRRKSNDGAAGLLLLLIAAAAVATLFGLAIAAPIILFVWWLYCEAQRLTQPHTQPGADLNEGVRLETLDNLLVEYQDSRENILKIGNESGIPRRGDNFFDGRYGAGRDVNNQLERLDSEIEKLVLEKFEFQNKISSRVKNWTNIRARTTGARVGIAVYIVMFTIVVGMSPPWAAAIGKLTDIFGLKLSDMMAMAFGSSAVASVVAGGALWLTTSANNKTS